MQPSDLGTFDGLLPGPQIEIWYVKGDYFRDFSFGDIAAFDPANPGKTHIMLGTIGGLAGHSQSFRTEARQAILRSVFVAMQAEMWGRDIERANALVLARGLEHSSMSIGDMVRFREPATETYLLTYEKPGSLGSSTWKRY